MKQEYAANYRMLFERHWWWRTRERFLLKRIPKFCPEGGFGSILDIGCGDGLFFASLAQFGDPEGIEIDKSIVSHELTESGRIYIGSLDESFDRGQRYGLILLLDVLEHLPNPKQTMATARSLLEPGGRIIVTVPAFRLLWTSHDDFNQHLTRYRMEELRELAEEVGLVTLTADYFFVGLAPLKLIVRCLESIGRSTQKPTSLPPTWLNTLMLGLCTLEDMVLGRLSPPFGSSIFAVFSDPGVDSHG